MSWLTEQQQEAATKLAQAGGRGIIWWKIGEGKTRIALSIWRQTVAIRDKQMLLVVCSPQAFRQWKDEIKILDPFLLHGVHFLSYGMLSSKDYRWDNYCERGQYAMVILDELWLYSNPRTQRTINAHKLTEKTPAVGLSGSMITNRNLTALYGQASAVGISGVVARNFTHFRSQFLVTYEDHGLKFTAKKGALKTIQQRLAPFVSIHFPKDQRETRIQNVTVEPTPIQQLYFDTVSNDYYTRFPDGTEIEIKNAANLISKLQQISDGVVINDAGQRTFIESSKHTRLIELLAELSEAGQRVVVWVAFKATATMLCQSLGKKAAILSGDDPFDYTGWASGMYDHAVCTIGSGASLNDFAHCQYSIVYSSPYSHRALQQAMGRTNRVNSRHQVCHYYFMQTDGGVDEQVYNTVLLTGQLEEQYIKTSTEVIKQYMKRYVNANSKLQNK